MLRIDSVEASEILEIRLAVLRKGMRIEDCHFEGDNDSSTCHLVAKDHSKAVGCCSLMKKDWSEYENLSYQLRGMAVLEPHQGRGVGAELLKAAESVVRDKNVELIWFNARIGAVNFYQKFGYEIVSDEFEISGVGPHVKMLKRLLQ